MKFNLGVFDREFMPELTRKPYPYIMFKGVGDSQIKQDIQHNSLGYRGDAPLPEKKSTEFRIFFLGGSTVWAGDPPIPAILNMIFQREGFNRVKVYNFGVVSSVSSMELARTVFEVIDFHPDLIVFYNGANDMYSPFCYDPRPGYPYNFIVYENNPLYKDPYPGFTLFLYNSEFLRIILKDYFKESFLNFTAQKFDSGWNTAGWREQIAEIYVKNLTKSQEIARSFGSDFIVLFQPMVYFKDQLSNQEQDFINPQDLEHYLLTRDIILQKTTEANKTSGLRFFDISDIYDTSGESVFSDIVHTKQEAKNKVAEVIYSQIISSYELPR